MKKHFTTPEKKQELKMENLIFNDTIHVQFVTEYCTINVVWNDQFAKEAPQVEY